MSGGMVPWEQWGGKTKLVVVKGRKMESSKKQPIFADHHPPGHVIAEPFALTRKFPRRRHIEAFQLHELPNIGRNDSWEVAGRQSEA